MAAIQTTAPVSPGSSGGGLFDEESRLVGLTTMILRDSQNLNFAVPINWLRDLPARSAAAIAQMKSRADGAEQSQAPRVAAAPAPRAEASPPAPVVPPPARPAPRADERSASIPKAVAPTTRPAVPAPAAGGDINDLRIFDNYRPSVRAAYLEFLKRPLPRAFALSDNGGSYQAWGRVPRDPNDSPDPAVRVIPGCEKFHQSRCRLYVVDETVVYKP